MGRNKKPIALAAGVLLLLGMLLGYARWSSRDADGNRAELLAMMPDDGNIALFVDLSGLRSSAFLGQFFALAPQPPPDSDYAQFVQATGFNYERDLDRVAVSVDRQPQAQTVFAIAEGRFDRKRIEGYGAQFGALQTADGRTIYAVPTDHSARKVYFTFLRDDRVAWANDSSYFFQPAAKTSSTVWHEHFARVAGTPVFVILRQDAGAANALAEAPGGLRSPQLAMLLNQLQWISIGGKPQGNLLRVVVDGESANENTVHQLKELLTGLVVMAQTGLNDVKLRKQLDPELRQGYLELLDSAEIQQLDRGSSKSVRVIFDVTPRLLEGATHNASNGPPGTSAHSR